MDKRSGWWRGVEPVSQSGFRRPPSSSVVTGGAACHAEGRRFESDQPLFQYLRPITAQASCVALNASSGRRVVARLVAGRTSVRCGYDRPLRVRQVSTAPA